MPGIYNARIARRRTPIIVSKASVPSVEGPRLGDNLQIVDEREAIGRQVGQIRSRVGIAEIDVSVRAEGRRSPRRRVCRSSDYRRTSSRCSPAGAAVGIDSDRHSMPSQAARSLSLIPFCCAGPPLFAPWTG